MYAPATHFTVAAHAGTLVGHAAPAGGRWPAGVELWGAERLLAVTSATRYSDAAAAESLRHGWCGFVIPGAGEAFAIGSDLTLRCAASGTVLATVPLKETIGPTIERPRLSLAEMIAHVREASCASEVGQIMPFALAFSRKVGVGEFVEKSCMMLLRRFVGFGEAKELLELTGDEDPETILELVSLTAEFEDDPLAYIPGPFHHEFLYGYDAFG